LYCAGSYGGQAVIEAIDTESDSVTDVLTGFTTATSVGGMSLSTDGRYIGIIQSVSSFEPRPALVLDVRTHEVVAQLSSDINGLLFLSDGKRLLGICNDSTLVYSIPSFSLIDTWQVELTLCREVPRTSWLIGVDRPPASQGQQDRGLITIFDQDTRVLRDSFRIDQHPGDFGFAVNGLEVFSDQKTLAAFSGNEVIRYDYINKHALYHAITDDDAFANISVSPDESEIWITKYDLEIQIGHPYVGYLIVLNAKTGGVEDTIQTIGYRVDVPGKPVPVRSVIFHPSFSKAYVSAYSSRPGLIVIDRATHEIDDALFKDIYHHTMWLDIAPY
jgi:WD40 repeat protein